MQRKLGKLREPLFLGPLLTLGVIILTELLTVGSLDLPTPILLLIPVSYVAFAGGLGAGLFSAALSSLYALHFYSGPEGFLVYSGEDALRLLGFVVAVFALAGMVGALRRSAHRYQQELRESEGRTRDLMEAVPLGVGLLSPKNGGGFEEMNPTLWKTFGYESREEFQTVPLRDHYYDPDDRERLLDLHARGLLRDHEVRFKRSDGTPFWAAITSAKGGRDAGGGRIILALRDVTDVKAAETARRESEARNAATISSSLDAIITIDEQGRIHEFNPAAQRTFGYTREETLGREMSELIIPPSLRELHREGLQRHLTTGESRILDQHLELEAMRADGSEFPAEVAITRIDHDGRPMFTGYVRDITGRKQAEERLRRSEGRFRRAIEHAGESVFVHDLEGRIVDTNQRACETLGYTREELLTLRIPDIEKHFSPEGVRKLWRRMLSGGALSVEGSHSRKDGSSFPVEVRVGVFQSEGEQLIIALARDITERKQAERQLQLRAEELERVNRELARKNEENEMFVYSVSHDLRSPLVNLEGFSQELSIVGQDLRSLIAESDLPPETRARGLALVDEEMGESLYFIRNGVGRLSNIIDALLRLSRAGRVEYHWRAVDVESLIGRVVDSMRETIESQGASIRVDRLPPALGDSTSLEQVFANLLGNAVKYLDPERPGRVEVGGEPEPESGTVLYHVRDNGLGMTAHATTRVFQVFQRAHPEATEGEGVGLALVRRTVERHGGSVWVESTQGEGSTFFVRLREAPEPEGD